MKLSELANQLSEQLNQTVYFGPQGFSLFTSKQQLKKAQRDYASAKGAASKAPQMLWQDNWQVIGRDTELGDPYFIDTESNDLTVMTGFFGDKGWQVELVATSLVDFIRCLHLIAEHGRQTQPVFIPEQDTISDTFTLQMMQTKLIELSGVEGFWTAFFKCYLDWLQEEA